MKNLNLRINSFLLLSLFLGACSEKLEDKSEVEARQLFSDSAETIISFSKKIESSSDSMSVDSLSEVFEKRITELNFKYAPEIDYKLTEQENDSLYKLMVNFKDLTKRKLEELAEKPEVADTITE